MVLGLESRLYAGAMTTSPDISAILADLAAGRIDSAEAARRIETAQASSDTPPTPEPPRTESSRPKAGAKGAERVSIRSVGRRVRVVADGSVTGVYVDGPHILRRNGSTIEVSSDGDVGPQFKDFSLLKMPRNLDDLSTIALGPEIVVRAHPSLVVDAEVTASGLTIEGMPKVGRVRVTAGGVTVRGAFEATDVLVQAGNATVEGPISQGRSRIRCESGALTVTLTTGANVTVRGTAQMGKINWPGEAGTIDELILGHGTARLDLEVVMGMGFVKEAD